EPVRPRRRGDRDRVERLEQGHDVPDPGQRIAVVVVETRVIPARTTVAPAPLALRDGRLGEGQILLLSGAKRLLSGRGAARGDSGTVPVRGWRALPRHARVAHGDGPRRERRGRSCGCAKTR